MTYPTEGEYIQRKGTEFLLRKGTNKRIYFKRISDNRFLVNCRHSDCFIGQPRLECSLDEAREYWVRFRRVGYIYIRNDQQELAYLDHQRDLEEARSEKYWQEMDAMSEEQWERWDRQMQSILNEPDAVDPDLDEEETFSENHGGYGLSDLYYEFSGQNIGLETNEMEMPPHPPENDL